MSLKKMYFSFVSYYDSTPPVLHMKFSVLIENCSACCMMCSVSLEEAFQMFENDSDAIWAPELHFVFKES